MKFIWLAVIIAAGWAPALAQTTPSGPSVASVARIPILEAKLDSLKTVDHIRGVSIKFAPSQRAGRHQHPIPVVGYVTRGVIKFQVEGQPERTLRAGESFLEPANTMISAFDNASATEEATFISFYLMGPGETEVVRAAP